VALARAFAVDPDLLLLDEPFVSLDDTLALRLRDELIDLVNRRPVTTLLVTHNVDEAIALADRVFLLTSSPARVVAEIPIERPRTHRSPEEMAAIRAEIAMKRGAEKGANNAVGSPGGLTSALQRRPR
jgi:NitT/TauT family transport system ATP-binding protein